MALLYALQAPYLWLKSRFRLPGPMDFACWLVAAPECTVLCRQSQCTAPNCLHPVQRTDLVSVVHASSGVQGPAARTPGDRVPGVLRLGVDQSALEPRAQFRYRPVQATAEYLHAVWWLRAVAALPQRIVQTDLLQRCGDCAGGEPG